MKFIEDWKINTTALSTQKYTLIEGEMIEHIDLQLARLILDDRTKDEFGNEVVSAESRVEFGKLIDRITETIPHRNKGSLLNNRSSVVI